MVTSIDDIKKHQALLVSRSSLGVIEMTSSSSPHLRRIQIDSHSHSLFSLLSSSITRDRSAPSSRSSILLIVIVKTTVYRRHYILVVYFDNKKQQQQQQRSSQIPNTAKTKQYITGSIISLRIYLPLFMDRRQRNSPSYFI